MIILMRQDATPDDIAAVCARVHDIGLMAHEIPGKIRVAIGVTGNNGAISADHFCSLPGVAECVPVSRPYKLVSKEIKTEPTIVNVRGASIGGGELQIIAGPCGVESRDQVMKTAQTVADSGAKFFRGGAYKPRTSPYAFQGMKEEGLRLLEEVRGQFDLRIITEVKDVGSLPAVAEVADVLQIGARNMQNFSLLEAAGRQPKPVLLKRGISATLQEFFMAAEYLLALGNNSVIFCERGIRTFETMTRNTFDLSAIPMIKHHTHLPVVADPSHGVGIAWAVPAMARASVAAGADAVMIETHPDPARALSDGQQSLTLEGYAKLAAELFSLHNWLASPR